MSFPRYPKYKDSGVEWLGEVPAHWEVGPLKRYWTVTDCKHITAEFVDDGVPIVSIREVQGRWIDLEEAKCTTEIFYELLIEGGRRPMPGDLIFSRNATVGEVGQVHADHPRFAMGQDVVLLRKLSPELSSDYMQQVIRSTAVTHQLAMLMIGSTFKRINVEEIRSLVVPTPPAAEQNKIAAFLDRETARIDALVTEQQRLIDLLKEKRQAVISHAVTKGLNPDAPMKPSGVDWLGEVPAHWEVVPLRHSITKVDQGWSPQCLGEPAPEGEWGVLKVGCGNGDKFDPREQKALPSDVAPLEQYEIKAGDILMSRGNTLELVGMATLVPEVRRRLLLSDLLYRFHALSWCTDPEFLVLSLRSRSVRFQIEREATGTSPSMKKIGQATVRSLVIPRPSLTEQRAIVGYIREQTAKIDLLAAEAQRAIELLQERRAALISATVTGQIDVRAIAARAAA